MSALSIAEVLEKAADLIEPEGKWGQGRWGDVSTCMCAEGAIYAATGNAPWCGDAGDEASEVLASMLAEYSGNSIATWNDHPSRTQAEVVAKLREAAALARREGR